LSSLFHSRVETAPCPCHPAQSAPGLLLMDPLVQRTNFLANTAGGPSSPERFRARPCNKAGPSPRAAPKSSASNARWTTRGPCGHCNARILVCMENPFRAGKWPRRMTDGPCLGGQGPHSEAPRPRHPGPALSQK
jgi:hypothetical protein